MAGPQVSMVVLQKATPQRRPTMTDMTVTHTSPVLVAIDIAKKPA